MSVGEKIAEARMAKGFSQEDVAGILGISTQAVSKWENDKCEPGRKHLVRLHQILGLSAEALLGIPEKEKPPEVPTPDWELGDVNFNPEHMYTFLKAKAQDAGMVQTLAALPFMREKHGAIMQMKYSNYGFDTPYMVHPLTLACHALAMGLKEDDILAACLLHDVVEDTEAEVKDLPEEITEPVREAVRLVSKNEYDHAQLNWEEIYYENIRKNPLACLVKCLDRANNLAGMADYFTREKKIKYILAAERYYPALLDVRKNTQKYNDAWWLLRYQMITLVETFKRML